MNKSVVRKSAFYKHLILQTTLSPHSTSEVYQETNYDEKVIFSKLLSVQFYFLHLVLIRMCIHTIRWLSAMIKNSGRDSLKITTVTTQCHAK